MRPLYEIDKDILACVDLETGEIIEPEKLDALEMEREKKIEGVILWRKDLVAEEKALDDEIKILTARKKACQNKAEQLKNYAQYALQGEKFKTERCSVSYRTTKSIVIDDLHSLPVEVWKDLTEDWISKGKIKDLIEAGQEVKGAHQEEKQSIIIK